MCAQIINRRECLGVFAGLGAGALLTACNKGPLPLPDLLPTPALEPSPNNDLFSPEEMETIFSLIADPEPETTIPSAEPLILKIARSVSQELIAIQTSIESTPSSEGTSPKLAQIEQLKSIITGQSINPAEVKDLTDASYQEQWQAIIPLLYVQGLLLRNTHQDQLAFNVLCAVKMLAAPLQANIDQLQDPNHYLSLSEGAKLLNLAAVNTNVQLASLVAEGKISTRGITQELFRDVLSTIDDARFESLMELAKAAEAMPTDTTEALEAKEEQIKFCLAHFYTLMSRSMQDRGIFPPDNSSSDRRNWISRDGGGFERVKELFPLVKIERDIETLSPETLSYSYLIQNEAINSSFYDNKGNNIQIENVSLTAIQDYFNLQGIPCSEIQTLASIKQNPNYKTAVLGFNDEQIANWAKSQGIVLLNNCSFHQITDTSERIPSVNWHTVIALESQKTGKIMLAVPQNEPSKIFMITGSSDHFIVSKKSNDITVAGYQITNFLEFLKEFYSNPYLQQDTTMPPAQLIALYNQENLANYVRPGQNAIYIPKNAPIYFLNQDGQGWTVSSTHPSEESRPNFGEIGTVFTLAEGKKVSVADPQTGEISDYYVLREATSGFVAVRASETVAFEQRNFLQYLFGSHRMLALTALLTDFPIGFSKRDAFPLQTLETAVGIPKLFTKDFPKIKTPAGLETLLFNDSFLKDHFDTKPPSVISGLPVKIVTERVYPGTEMETMEATGLKIIKRSALVKALQILQAVSIYLLYKQLTAEQKSNLHTMIEAVAPYLANRSDLFDPQLWDDHEVQTIHFQNNLIWHAP